MSSYQTADSSGVFTYELNYAKDTHGWTISSLNIQKLGRVIFSKKNMGGVYRAESVLIAQGINLCEAVIKHLRRG